MSEESIAAPQRMDWKKSSYSGAEGGDCVEVATRPEGVHVRDSKDPSGPWLTVTPAAWSAFLAFTAQQS